MWFGGLARRIRMAKLMFVGDQLCSRAV
jgi:hypothetical protein